MVKIFTGSTDCGFLTFMALMVLPSLSSCTLQQISLLPRSDVPLDRSQVSYSYYCLAGIMTRKNVLSPSLVVKADHVLEWVWKKLDFQSAGSERRLRYTI